MNEKNEQVQTPPLWLRIIKKINNHKIIIKKLL